MISVIFYCFAINDWKERLSRQINRLVSSGLYDGADELFLFVTDTSGVLESEVRDLIKDLPKIILEYTTNNYGEGFLALSKLDELAREQKDRKLFYFHTKGVFNKYKNFETKEINDLKVRGVDCWVEMLEFFLIDNWKLCVDKLNENEIVGTICNGFWWWGNFWWTKSSHVKNIPSIKEIYHSRWDAEAWIHGFASDKEKIKHLELKPIKYDPYYTVLPKYFYDNSIDTTNIKINIIQALYGYFAEQRDEGRQPPKNSEMHIDVTEKIKNLVESDPRVEIRPEQMVESDVAPGFEKILRIRFSTNIDPENEYVITSFLNWSFSIIS